MNKQTLFILLGFTLLINVITSFITNAYISNDNSQGSSLNKEQFSVSINYNKHMIVKLNQRILDIQQQLNEPSSTVVTDSELDEMSESTSSLVSKVTRLTAEISSIKQQFYSLVQTTTASINKLSQDNTLLLATDNTTTKSLKQPITMEERQAIIQKEEEEMESTFETAFYDDDDSDVDWTNNVTEKVDNLINTNKLGNTAQLLDVECKSKLCKIYLSNSKSSESDDFTILKSLGNVNAYIVNKKSDASGLKEKVLYISREGEELPETASIN